MPKIVTVVGARPQFVKAAPVSQALASEGFSEFIIHTGQHFDANMSDIFFSDLGIPAPAYNLEIHSLDHGAMTGRMLEAIEKVLRAEKPDLVLLYGDTNSTIAGALAAAKLLVPVAHVEAGLRSHNRAMPEEINRVVTDHLSTLLFCPTRAAAEHLASEGIRDGVHEVGDVMYDITLLATERAAPRSTVLDDLGLTPGGYSVATLHRQENTDDPARLRAMVALLKEAARSRPLVMPLHPRSANRLKAEGLDLEGIAVIAPLGYLDMTQLVHHSAEVLTDSGGLQKEAYFHRVPCVTLRDETEWVETVEAGWNRLWNQDGYATPRRDIADYGEGKAAERIASVLAKEIAKRT